LFLRQEPLNHTLEFFVWLTVEDTRPALDHLSFAPGAPKIQQPKEAALPRLEGSFATGTATTTK
jgi:hypothetical protein